jgi:hypothetical protein
LGIRTSVAALLQVKFVLLEWDVKVDIFKQPGESMTGAVGIGWDTPENSNGWKARALYRNSRPRNGRTLSAGPGRDGVSWYTLKNSNGWNVMALYRKSQPNDGRNLPAVSEDAQKRAREINK